MMARILGRRDFLSTSAGLMSAVAAGAMLRPSATEAAPSPAADATSLRIVIDGRHEFAYRSLAGPAASAVRYRHDGVLVSLLLESGLSRTPRPVVLQLGHGPDASRRALALRHGGPDEIDALVVGAGHFEPLGALIDLLGERPHGAAVGVDHPILISGRALVNVPVTWTGAANVASAALVPHTVAAFTIKSRLRYIALDGWRDDASDGGPQQL